MPTIQSYTLNKRQHRRCRNNDNLKRATKPDHCFAVTGKRYSPPHSRVSRRILAYA